MADRPVEGNPSSFLPGHVAIHYSGGHPMTKAQEVFDKVNELMESGLEMSAAFKQLAEETGRPYDSLRGSYYSHKSKTEGGPKSSRPRRRETTPEDALEDARAALLRALSAIDREVEAAGDRVVEAKREHEALSESADERKTAITERLEALK
jgi:hypothetical protein